MAGLIRYRKVALVLGLPHCWSEVCLWAAMPTLIPRDRSLENLLQSFEGSSGFD